jgi:polyhydroxyalkanoate synthesis repressor PhaR
MANHPIVIKKYANRRLYDTSASRYVNLEDIAGLVRNGKDVQVVDAATGDDVTRITLTQIIVDDAREQPSGLPLELLRQLIVTSDRVGQEFILWYLRSAYDAYQKVQSSLHSGLSEMQAAALSPINLVRNFMQRSPSEATASDNELEQLRRRVSELEARSRENARAVKVGVRGRNASKRVRKQKKQRS